MARILLMTRLADCRLPGVNSSAGLSVNKKAPGMRVKILEREERREEGRRSEVR